MVGIEILIGFVIVFFIVVWHSIKYAFKPETCPKCGATMETFYDEEKGKFINECSRCGYKEEL